MGKKSKRSRNSNSTSRPPPAIRENEEETLENLRFADPFVEEVVQQEEEDDDRKLPPAGEDDENEEDVMIQQDTVEAWNPFTHGGQGGPLEMDASAYKMHHAMTPEWPSLSFHFVADDLGEARSRFPHTLTAVSGSQADAPDKNILTVMKISNLSKMNVETEDDILGEEFNPDKDEDSQSSEEEEEVDLDPIVEHYSIPHPFGGINRVRTMPQNQNIVATWSDDATVNIFDITAIRQRFDASEGKGGISMDIPKKPTFRYHEHSTEGFALDWSKTGQLVTGDCNGGIHVWKNRADGGYSPAPFFTESSESVEDLQWSPTEPTVFCSGNCNGYVRIFDTRAPNKAMLSHKIHDADVNVLSWNKIVTNLLATGGDDGTLSVYDLRHFTQTVKPLARFTPHRTPLTSVEWHPTDESMLAASDSVGTYIYDCSVEDDTDHMMHNSNNDLPPQLLFVHCGSEQYKEVHWHPQITSCIMTTALTGYSIFIPSNL